MRARTRVLDVDVASRDEALARDVVRFLSVSTTTGTTRVSVSAADRDECRVATTAAATCALVTIGTEGEARETLVKEDVRAFFDVVEG